MAERPEPKYANVVQVTTRPFGTLFDFGFKSPERQRAALERELGRLENGYGLTPLRARGLARVRQHADLVLIARLGQALVRAGAVPLAA